MLPLFSHTVTRDTPQSLVNEFPVKFEFPTIINEMSHIGTTMLMIRNKKKTFRNKNQSY